jgi:hypothetical protein
LKKINECTAPLACACQKTDVVVSGCVTFLDDIGDLHAANDFVAAMAQMEGEIWLPGVMSEKRMLYFSDLTDQDWQLIYFHPKHFMCPKVVWTKIKHSVTAYCDGLPVQGRLGFGEVRCILKCIAAAVAPKRAQPGHQFWSL